MDSPTTSKASLYQMNWLIQNFAHREKKKPIRSNLFPASTEAEPADYQFQMELTHTKDVVSVDVFMAKGKINQEMDYRVAFLDAHYVKRFVVGKLWWF